MLAMLASRHPTPCPALSDLKGARAFLQAEWRYALRLTDDSHLRHTCSSSCGCAAARPAGLPGCAGCSCSSAPAAGPTAESPPALPAPPGGPSSRHGESTSSSAGTSSTCEQTSRFVHVVIDLRVLVGSPSSRHGESTPSSAGTSAGTKHRRDHQACWHWLRKRHCLCPRSDCDSSSPALLPGQHARQCRTTGTVAKELQAGDTF